MTLLQPCTINSPFDGTKYNANMVLAEESFLDLGPYIISGLAVSIGSGLSVNVASGTASIGGRVTAASTTIAGLTDNTTNHLFTLNTGAGTSNTTGTPPANSAKLGTCVTAGGIVTSINMGRTSGRQQFVQPQNLIPGGPSAGTASAGHLDGINLANWGATDAEGQAVYGLLPAGAVPAPDLSGAVILAPNTATRNTIQPTADTNAGLIIRGHSPTQSAKLLDLQTSAGSAIVSVTGTDPSGIATSMLVRSFGHTGGVTIVDIDGFMHDPIQVFGQGATSPFFYVSNGISDNILNVTGTADNSELSLFGFPGQTSALVYCQAGPFSTARAFLVDSDASLRFMAHDSVTLVNVGSLVQGFKSNTHASYTGRILLNAYDSSGIREALRAEGDGTNARIGFLGAAAVARAAAYTLSGSATRTFPTDPSGVYTGIDNLQGAGTPYAQVTDLNTLRSVVSSLLGVVRQMATDLGSTSGYGLLNA